MKTKRNLITIGLIVIVLFTIGILTKVKSFSSNNTNSINIVEEVTSSEVTQNNSNAKVATHYNLQNEYFKSFAGSITESSVNQILFINDTTDSKLTTKGITLTTPVRTTDSVEAYFEVVNSVGYLVILNTTGELISIDNTERDVYGQLVGADSFFGGSTSLYTNLTHIDFNGVFTNASGVENFDLMFANLPKLENIDGLDGFDFSYSSNGSPGSMINMFAGTDVSSIDLTSIDTSNIEDMTSMFQTSSSSTDIDLSGWDVSKVENVSQMFYLFESDASITLTVSGWDFSNDMTSMLKMFSGSQFNKIDASNMDVSTINTFSDCFDSAKASTIDLTGWNTENASKMDKMFKGLNLENLILSHFTTASVMNFSEIFAESTFKLLDISSFTFKSGTNTSGFFNESQLDVIVTPTTSPMNGVVIELPGNYVEKPYVSGNKVYDEIDDNATSKTIYKTQTYTVTFEYNNGQSPTTEDATVGELVAYPTIVGTLTGYTFKGWSKTNEKDGTDVILKQFEYRYDFFEDTTLYAIWEANKYTVHFSANGGSGTQYSQELTYDLAAKLEEIKYSKAGYNFAGWSYTETGEVEFLNKAEVLNLTDTNQIVLHAIWVGVKYEIKFNENTGSGTMQNQEMTYGEYSTLSKNSFTKEGYTFSGWSTTFDGESIFEDERSVRNLTQTENGIVELFAIWEAITYDVIFNANTGSGTMLFQEMIYDSGVGIKKNEFTKVGYTFSGWNTLANGEGDRYTDEQVVNLTSTADALVTLFAMWEANNYEVEFDANTGGGSMLNQSMTYDTTVALSANAFSKPGYTFKEWNTDAGGSGTGYADEDDVINLTTTNNATVTLYAIWEANNYEVEFDANTGGGSMLNQSMTYDTTVALTANAFSKTGYTFLEWNTDSSGSGDSYVDSDDVVNLTTTNGATVTLFAIWEAITYEVKFDANTGSGSMTNQPMTYDSEVSLTLNKFTKEDFIFVGWNTDVNGLGTDYTNGESVSNLTTTQGDTVTLYAVWTESPTYFVEFNANGGQGNMLNQVHIIGTTTILTKNGFTKDNYVFQGWSLSPTGTVEFTDEQAVEITTTDGATVTLFAVWLPNSYTETFIGDAGVSMSSNNQLYHDSEYIVTLTLKSLFVVDTIKISINGVELSTSEYTVDGNNYIVSPLSGNITIEVTTKDLRDDIKEELEDYYDDLIEKNPGLTEDQLEDLKDALEDALENADKSETLEDLEDALTNGKIEMDKVLRSSNYWDIIPLIIAIIVMMLVLLIVAIITNSLRKRRINKLKEKYYVVSVY